jgi:hypothetical protein
VRLTFLTALLFASLAALHAGEFRLARAGGYTFTAALPPANLGLTLTSCQKLRADLGVTLGDPGGTDTNLRSHWSNKSTGLVDDIPGEITLTPVLSEEMNPR